VIYLRRTTRKHRVRSRALVRAAGVLLGAVGLREASLSLSLVGDGAMRRLNREYRGRDRATDVLAFPLFAPFALPGAGDGAAERLLGDVVISLDSAERQARDYGARLDAEVKRLLIHGLLHLLGHDHEQPVERRRMQAEERRLARAIGLDWPYDATTAGEAAPKSGKGSRR